MRLKKTIKERDYKIISRTSSKPTVIWHFRCARNLGTSSLIMWSASLRALPEEWLLYVGLKNLGNAQCFVNLLQCIFHTPLLRGIMLSKQHHHESYCSYKHHTVLIIMKNIGHMFCQLGISEFSVNALSSCSSCCSTAAVQRPEM